MVLNESKSIAINSTGGKYRELPSNGWFKCPDYRQRLSIKVQKFDAYGRKFLHSAEPVLVSQSPPRQKFQSCNLDDRAA